MKWLSNRNDFHPVLRLERAASAQTSRRSATSWPPGTTCSSRSRSKPTKPWVSHSLNNKSVWLLREPSLTDHVSCPNCLRFLERRFWMSSRMKLQERWRSVTSHWVRIKNEWRKTGALARDLKVLQLKNRGITYNLLLKNNLNHWQMLGDGEEPITQQIHNKP